MNPDPSPETSLLTSDETARYLGVSPKTLARWVKTGRFPAPLRIGHPARPRLRFRKAAVDHFLAQAAREVANVG